MLRYLPILKKIFRVIIAIAIGIGFLCINWEEGYLRSDIEDYRNSMKTYNKYFAILTLIIISARFLIKRPRNLKSKYLSLKQDLIYYVFIILLLELSILSSFHKFLTDLSLATNKIKTKGRIERVYEKISYDDKTEELFIIDSKFDIESITISKNESQNLLNNSKIKLTFSLGLLNIPFDPKYKQ